MEARGLFERVYLARSLFEFFAMTEGVVNSEKNKTQLGIAVGIWAAAIALVSDAAVAYINGANDQILESKKAEAGRILESLKTGNPDDSATNLKFLLEAGLITDPATAQGLIEYLESRKAGEGAFLPNSDKVDPASSDSDKTSDAGLSAKAKSDLLLKYGILPGEKLRPLTPRWAVDGGRNSK